jgi:hypothetical protein
MGKGGKKMINKKIRELAKEKGVKLWQIADKLQLNDGNFSRLLRHELPKEKEQQILNIIYELSEERG